MREGLVGVYFTIIIIFSPFSLLEQKQVVQELVCDVEEGAVLSAEVKEVKDYGSIMEVKKVLLPVHHRHRWRRCSRLRCLFLMLLGY
jgi:hypothetical protein